MRSSISTALMVERSMPVNPDGNPITIQPFARGEKHMIYFSDDDLLGVAQPHNDPLVIKVRIDVQNVKRVMIDPGSSTDVIYKTLFDRMRGIKLKKTDHPIYSFACKPTWPLGVASLNVKLGPRSVTTDFLVVHVEAPFNAILGRPWIGAMRVVPSHIHQNLKFICDGALVTVRGSQSSARVCFKDAIGPTLTEVRPLAIEDADTRLSKASVFNQSLSLSTEVPSESSKRKSVETVEGQTSKQRSEE
jgi:hypothetical protein